MSAQFYSTWYHKDFKVASQTFLFKPRVLRFNISSKRQPYNMVTHAHDVQQPPLNNVLHLSRLLQHNFNMGQWFLPVVEQWLHHSRLSDKGWQQIWIMNDKYIGVELIFTLTIFSGLVYWQNSHLQCGIVELNLNSFEFIKDLATATGGLCVNPAYIVVTIKPTRVW